MKRLVFVNLIVGCFLCSSVLAGPKSPKKAPPPPPPPKASVYYAKFVKPIGQKKIPSPRRKDRMKVYEGCGPIAAAMLLGYWQT